MRIRALNVVPAELGIARRRESGGALLTVRNGSGRNVLILERNLVRLSAPMKHPVLPICLASLRPVLLLKVGTFGVGSGLGGGALNALLLGSGWMRHLGMASAGARAEQRERAANTSCFVGRAGCRGIWR